MDPITVGLKSFGSGRKCLLVSIDADQPDLWARLEQCCSVATQTQGAVHESASPFWSKKSNGLLHQDGDVSHVRRFNELLESKAISLELSGSNSSLAQIFKIFITKGLIGETGSETIVIPNLEVIQARINDNLTDHFCALPEQRRDDNPPLTIELSLLPEVADSFEKTQFCPIGGR
jgi:hypothetical protein